MEIENGRLLSLLNGFKNRRIALIGDLMLDRYLWGSVSRMSPEAPIPVVEVETTSESLGGAANVASNIYFLGGEPIVIGVVGDDDAGRAIRKKLETENLSCDGIVVDASRPTTVKTRIIAHKQQVVRTDLESRAPISPEIQRKLSDFLSRIIRDVDAVIIQDYNKGVLVADLINKVIAKCIANEKILAVDPKFDSFFEYKKVTVFKPNVPEVERALGVRLKTPTDVRAAGREILERLDCGCVLLTRGEDGMSLFLRNGAIENLPIRARKVRDVSGAGDTVTATLTLALAAGGTFMESSVIANIAAGQVCEEVGVVPIQMQKLSQVIQSQL